MTADPPIVMVALHAWRSAAAIERFHQRYPERPLIVALTGTDIYRFIHSHRQKTLRSLDLAHRLVGLHGLAADAIPKRYHGKLAIIYQSAPPLPRRLPPHRRWFEVLVVGHLRAEKDPLRAAKAARRLPEASRLRIIHLGRAQDERWGARARAEMARNPRYIWRGEVPGWKVRQASARASLMVLSSEHGGRRQCDLGGGDGGAARHRLQDRRIGRPARPRLSGLLSRWRQCGAGAPASARRAATQPSSPSFGAIAPPAPACSTYGESERRGAS